jgi:hypothetical protein
MKVDEGEVVGGFARAYDGAIVENIDTPVLRGIAASTGLWRNNAMTVEVTLENGRSWSRTFEGNYSKELSDCIFTTPNPYRLGIRVRGVMFVVDVANPDDAFELDVLPLSCAASDTKGGRMFLASDTEVYAFDGARIQWKSRRVSFDGIRDLVYANSQVRGTATDVGVEAVPFTIDAETGEATGGFEGFERWRVADD